MNITPPTPTPLRGWITSFHGNYKGKKLGPYYSRTWKVAGKIKREYIKPHDLERVRAACAAYKEKRKRESTNTQKLSFMIGNLSYISRLCKRLRTGQVTEADLNFVAQLDEKGYDIPGRPKLRSSPAKQGDPGMGAHSSRYTSIQEGVLSLLPQYRIPNTQDLATKDFMYPSATNSSSNKKPFLKSLAAMLKKPIQDRYAKETRDERWNRWQEMIKQQPEAPANVTRKLPEGLTQERIQSDANQLTDLLIQKFGSPGGPSAEQVRQSAIKKRLSEIENRPQNGKAVAAGLQRASRTQTTQALSEIENRPQNGKAVAAGLQPASRTQTTQAPGPFASPVVTQSHGNIGAPTKLNAQRLTLNASGPFVPSSPTTSDRPFSEELRRFKGDA